jgi:type II secretory pathway pseudopilin PulG
MKNKLITLKSIRSTQYAQRRTRAGFTLIELIVACTAALMIALLAGFLLKSGHQSWARAFNFANSKTQLDALSTSITFGSLGRKANKMDYTLYNISSGKFFPLPNPVDPEQVVTGQAVEFHYWDKDLDASLMDPAVTGTAYALFYLEGDKLMLDLGPYPPGAVDATGYRLSGSYVTTLTLAENVADLEFNHTTRSITGEGKGCVRLNLTIRDPNEETPVTVTAATLLRNTWP